MKKTDPDFWCAQSANNYTKLEDTEYIMWYSGVIIAKGDDGERLTPFDIGKRAFQEGLDYNHLSGWFKFVVFSKPKNEWFFCGDHAGSQFFFYDSENKSFSDRMLKLRAMRGKKAEPDMEAISELFTLNRTYCGKTIVKGILKTKPDCYYRFRDGNIEELSKNLEDFSSMDRHFSLEDVTFATLDAIGDEKVCAVLTGGTDSRAVLAALLAKGCKPSLVLTGHARNPDISISKKIADILALPLTIIDPSQREQGWLESSFAFLDGQYDVVLGYRHFQKARWAQEAGFKFEFGGIGGEFYKNAYCHPFRWGLFKKQSAQDLYEHLFQASSISWCGEKLKNAAQKDAESLREIARLGMCENSLLQRCNHIGFDMLRAGAGAITNGYASACCKIDPLMDRCLIAAASYEKPLAHSMHVWQRKQIARLAPELSGIETDQGYSCSLEPFKLSAERMKKFSFYAGRCIARIKRKMGWRYKSANAQYWNSDYVEARSTSAWTKAIKYCKTSGIIAADVTDEKIPMEQTGFILLVGMMFVDDSLCYHL